MVQGRIDKFCKENALLNQVFVKNSDLTVDDVITDAIAKNLFHGSLPVQFSLNFDFI